MFNPQIDCVQTDKLLEFASLISLTKSLVSQELDRRLPDSEIAAIQCMWEGIDYAEFSENYMQFMSRHKNCYKSVTKPKAVATLTSGASRMLKLFASYYGIDALTRTSFRRKIEDAHDSGIIDFQDSTGTKEISETSNFIGRKHEIELLQKSIKSKNVIFVWGNPGIGKSALLRQFSEKHLSKNSYFFAKYSDFSSLDSLLHFVYENYFEESKDLNNLIPYVIEHLTEREFQLIVDFEYDIDPEFGRFLESISNHKLPENSCIICISRKNCINNFDFNDETTLSYQLGPLENKSDYFPYLSTLKLKDKHLWDKIIDAYEGNFRELSYVAKFIREICSFTECKRLLQVN